MITYNKSKNETSKSLTAPNPILDSEQIEALERYWKISDSHIAEFTCNQTFSTIFTEKLTELRVSHGIGYTIDVCLNKEVDLLKFTFYNMIKD